MFVSFIMSFSAALAVFKVPSHLQALIADFNLSYTLGGLFMGLVGASVVVTAIPAGILISRYGTKRIGIAAIALMIIGAVVQALSPNAYLLFFGRIVEGIGVSFSLVTAITIISLSAPSAKRGLALGLYMACYPAGSVISMNLSSLIPLSYGWRIVWWLSSVFAIISLVFLALSSDRKVVHRPGFSMKRALSNPFLWLLPMANMGVGSPGNCILNWGPTYLNVARGVLVPVGSFLVSLTMFMAIPISPLGGWLADRVRPRKIVYALPLLALAVLYPLVPYVPLSLFLIFMLIIGFFNNLVPPAAMAEVAEIAGPEATSVGLAISMMMVNIGIMASSPIFGLIYDATSSWNLSFLSLVIYDALGLLSALPRKGK